MESIWGGSSDNAVRGNRLSDNIQGIHLKAGANNNVIYNNSLVNNVTQAMVLPDSSGNVFSLDAATGGNYWSDWRGPDADGDGFVDYPYVFAGGQDDLPLVERPVDFNDPALEAAVRQALGIPTDPIMPADMLNLTNFQPIRRDITDLTGLEYATNLTMLRLRLF